MEGRSGTGRLGQRYYYYKCRNVECGIRVVAPEVEEAVLAKMGALAEEPGILDRLVGATNTRLQRQLPVLGKRKKALERELLDVKSQADKLLGGWSDEIGAGARSLVAEKLGTLAERQEQLGAAIREVDEQIAQVQRAAVNVEAMREALSQVGQVYGQLTPIERKELFRLLVHRAEVTDCKMILEIKTGAGSPEGQAPDAGERYNTPGWLPDEDSNLEPSG
jgi:hypothetical protein